MLQNMVDVEFMEWHIRLYYYTFTNKMTQYYIFTQEEDVDSIIEELALLPPETVSSVFVKDNRRKYESWKNYKQASHSSKRMYPISVLELILVYKGVNHTGGFNNEAFL